MKKSTFIKPIHFFCGLLLLFLTIFIRVTGQSSGRIEINIPEIPGYVTLKCDFHMHTVFSDGLVWPTIRTEEAWMQGLDALSITDHIEYQPHKNDIQANHNRSYELAINSSGSYDLLLIRGAEITRDMPPGHLNAIFLKDANLLDTKEYKDAIKAAINQEAFIFWNHPGWKAQQPDTTRWFPEHTELYEKGWLHGIEVVNGGEYYPEAHQWCLEKKLTMIGNSDIHGISMNYNCAKGKHRPVTLVFAKEKTDKALKEALFDRRTVIYYENILIGEEKFLLPIFNQSVEIKNSDLTIEDGVNVQIHNHSDISYILESHGESKEVTGPKKITLPAHKTILFKINNNLKDFSGEKKVSLPYRVKNLLIAPQEGLPVKINLNMIFVSKEE